MRHVTPFRIAAVLLALFCAMHTVGGMLAQGSMGHAADAVFAGMKTVHFDFNGSDSTWYGFWFGFGLMVSAFLAMSAFICWWLERVRPESWAEVSPMAWALAGAHAVTAILSWKYFFAGPGVFATLVTVFLIVGIVRKQRRAAVSSVAMAA